MHNSDPYLPTPTKIALCPRCNRTFGPRVMLCPICECATRLVSVWGLETPLGPQQSP